MNESAVVGKALEKCWSEDAFLGELGGRFWKLTLQVCTDPRCFRRYADVAGVAVESISNVDGQRHASSTILLILQRFDVESQRARSGYN